MKGGTEQSIPGGNDRYFAALYSELRQLAERQLRRNSGLPITPTTLLHETYLGMASGNARFPDRNRFMGYAARAMRNLIVDFARERRALKRGSGFKLTQLDTSVCERAPEGESGADQLVQLSDALEELALHDARLAEIVDLRYFCGFSMTEIAAMQGMCERTVQRDWEKARILLFGALRDSTGP
jgi:RNA polymerase sigma factor (TIGR02999 family)